MCKFWFPLLVSRVHLPPFAPPGSCKSHETLMSLTPAVGHRWRLFCPACINVSRWSIPQDEADQAAAANNLGARYTKSRAYLEWAQESGPIGTTVWGDLPFLTGSADNGACRQRLPALG